MLATMVVESDSEVMTDDIGCEKSFLIFFHFYPNYHIQLNNLEKKTVIYRFCQKKKVIYRCQHPARSD